MGSLSVWHWLIFLVVALLFFGGGGKISAIMGDFAKGIKAFKKNMSEDDASMEATADKAGTAPTGTIAPPAGGAQAQQGASTGAQGTTTASR